MNNKRAQAAMEFLMTYGWAILVVLAAIGALAYFGVLNPSRLVPDRCSVAAGFDLKDCKADQQNLTISLYNGQGVDLTAVNVTINSTLGSDVTCNGVVVVGSLANGQTSSLTALCGFGATAPALGARLDADITITYQKSGEQLSHSTTGKIQRKVEQ